MDRPSPAQQRRWDLLRTRVRPDDADEDSTAHALAADQVRQTLASVPPFPSLRRGHRLHSDHTRDDSGDEQTQHLSAAAASPLAHSLRSSLTGRAQRLGARDLATGSSSSSGPFQGLSTSGGPDAASSYEQPQRDYDSEDSLLSDSLFTSRARGDASAHGGFSLPIFSPSHGAGRTVQDLFTSFSSPTSNNRAMPRVTKRIRDDSASADNYFAKVLARKGAVAVMSYDTIASDSNANDVWHESRSVAKLPARYSMLRRDDTPSLDSSPKRRSSVASRPVGPDAPPPSDHGSGSTDTVGRPVWRLPVELVEYIADYLNRDDIQALRLVSPELNHFVSQVIFKTVVVPFNTEIYGMLGPEPKPDLKGKKRARVDKPGYSWRNANGDEVYNGHGLDVFRGFGKHIRKYGMSFEVNEDTLAAPPEKTMTESKTTFWGRYDWPFEEYRRFDAVAGLETAADETPRMKIAFSELSNVRELALSVDSGLGWLNGPDRSIRGRILRRPPAVFGNSKAVPDRRAQAQDELWDAVKACHERANSDVRLATLYRLDGPRSWSEHNEQSMRAVNQPTLPYMTARLIHEAPPHDTAEGNVSASNEEPGDLDHLVLPPTTHKTGILFTANFTSTDGGQAMSPVVPANLTNAQKEWLLESEWAQRAFMSSYMLSVIDNPATFNAVHTLTISRLSDRYLSALDRPDFWASLPNLHTVTLIVLPDWRTVHKDEAGFVETPGVNPTAAVDRFHKLLRTHVACRPKIQKLTIGWATGGEHEEGLHGRNKLLLPSPLMQLGVRSDSGAAFTSEMLLATNAQRLGLVMLHLPFVERLTLKNCWTTPPSMLHFIKLHDQYSLKHLVLDSVSLTAMLRPQANANQAAPPAPVAPAAAVANANLGALPGAGAIWNTIQNQVNGGGQAALQLPAHMLPHQQPFAQIYVQTLQLQLQQLQANAGGAQQQNQIANLQTQLQQQLQQLQAQNNPLVLAPAQPITPVIFGQAQALQPQQTLPVLNVHNAALMQLSMQVQAMQQQFLHPHGNVVQAPLPAFAAPPTHLQQFANARPNLRAEPRTGSWVDIIDQVSPGTNLSDFGSEHSRADPQRRTSLQTVEFHSCGYARLPHAALEQHGVGTARSPTFTKRHMALEPAMLSAKWAHLGEIVQIIDQDELATLNAGWNLRTGWEDAEAAKAAEFDGQFPGGTGRFTGIIRRSDRVTDPTSASQ
ncbi:hypothetical protein T440DRAFT_399858 [Plenodomus tracheiphilus IPT5]|uniref:F-box domain-containing protein n=1 Tax=Plenodomus tracheiphilus IPT5 TaxID=1408161 RepID=A0A6A7B3B3_9PLEO|nr:hypothetical protein T440DRAFT_399858 [Plenodomus tracheiphilus IPT5]